MLLLKAKITLNKVHAINFEIFKLNIMKYFINTKLFIIIAGVLISGLVTSCTLFDLPLQEEYPYIYTSKDANINMTAYQFVESRQAIDMARMFEAINLTGLKSEYEKPDRTYIILNDAAFNNYLINKKIANLPSVNVQVLTNYLMSAIAKGKFTSLDLTTIPMEMDILFKNDTTKLFLNRIPVTASTANKYELYVNNFTGSLKYFKVRTSNILATNGVIHVVNDFPEYRVVVGP